MPFTSGQAWKLSKYLEECIQGSADETGFTQSPCPRLYVNVNGPLKGQSIGTASSLNIANKFASPLIVEQICFNEDLSGTQNAERQEQDKINPILLVHPRTMFVFMYF